MHLSFSSFEALWSSHSHKLPGLQEHNEHGMIAEIPELPCSAFRMCCCSRRFPVILSIENHCSVQQQRKIAQYLKGIFQDKLDLSSIDPGETKQLPSPQSLKGKILVKVTTQRNAFKGMNDQLSPPSLPANWFLRRIIITVRTWRVVLICVCTLLQIIYSHTLRKS